MGPEPSIEERMVSDASHKRKYDEQAKSAYMVREKYLRSPDFEDLKQEVEKFMREQIQVRSKILECNYHVINRLKLYRCHLKWWGLPNGKENFREYSIGLSAKDPDTLRYKVDNFIKRKVPEGDFIDVCYYSWGFSCNDKPHCARVTYYLPKVK